MRRSADGLPGERPSSSPPRSVARGVAWVVAALLSPSLAGAEVEHQEAAPADFVRLLAPELGAGERVRAVAGGELLVAWEPGSTFDSVHVEEWEAFLSLDGGERYPVRLTPHLDASIRSFSVVLPNIVSAHGRMLLRFGDERDEVEVDLAGEIALEPGPGNRAALARTAYAPGEPARPDQAGVIAWLDGDRLGSRGREITGSEPVPEALRSSHFFRGGLGSRTGLPRSAPSIATLASSTAARLPRPSAVELRPTGAQSKHGAPDLALLGRRNQ